MSRLPHAAAAGDTARQQLPKPGKNQRCNQKVQLLGCGGYSFEVISISLCSLISEMESKRRQWLYLPVFLKGEPHVLLHLLETVVVGVNQVERQRIGQGAVSPSWRDP